MNPAAVILWCITFLIVWPIWGIKAACLSVAAWMILGLILPFIRK